MDFASQIIEITGTNPKKMKKAELVQRLQTVQEYCKTFIRECRGGGRPVDEEVEEEEVEEEEVEEEEVEDFNADFMRELATAQKRVKKHKLDRKRKADDSGSEDSVVLDERGLDGAHDSVDEDSPYTRQLPRSRRFKADVEKEEEEEEEEEEEGTHYSFMRYRDESESESENESDF